LPRDQYLTALLSFNAGVELGQLSVILLAFAALGWFHRRPWYRARIAVPLSVAIGLIGLYWAVERVFWP
ncbi:MAG TPA: HupE/UreJ family protein, partial [Acidobacteriota bacterium]